MKIASTQASTALIMLDFLHLGSPILQEPGVLR